MKLFRFKTKIQKMSNILQSDKNLSRTQPYMNKPQGHGKEKFLSPLKNCQNCIPPPLRGCPCGDFPPPIWNFRQIFPPHMSFGIKIH